MLIKIATIDQLDFVREISEKDWMAQGKSPDWYFRRGYEALAVIVYEVQRARFRPESILDFGCGHGCVARMLTAHWPKARIIGQDVNPDWMTWVERVIGVETVVSAARIREVELPRESYDVIWAGSVFSHIPREAAEYLLCQFRNALTARGVVIFSTAGQIMRNAYRPGSMKFISDEAIAEMAADFDRGEYGFHTYDKPTYNEWGHALTPYRWFLEKSLELNMPLSGFYEAGWGGVQDVVAMRKTPNPYSWT